MLKLMSEAGKKLHKNKSQSHFIFYHLRIFNLSTVILRQILHYELLVLMVHRPKSILIRYSATFTVHLFVRFFQRTLTYFESLD